MMAHGTSVRAEVRAHRRARRQLAFLRAVITTREDQLGKVQDRLRQIADMQDRLRDPRLRPSSRPALALMLTVAVALAFWAYSVQRTPSLSLGILQQTICLQSQ